MRVVPNQAPTPELQERICRSVAPLLGIGVEFQVRVVEGIQPGPGGKYRHSRSLIGSAYETNPVMITDG